MIADERPDLNDLWNYDDPAGTTSALLGQF